MAIDTHDQTVPQAADQWDPRGDSQQWVSLDQGATLLGISVKTLRRRIHKGQIVARRVEIPGGFTYRVQVSPQRGEALGSPLDGAGIPSGQRVTQAREGVDQPAFEAFRDIVEQLQREKALLHRDNLELAGRVGFLQAKLQDAEAKIALLEAPKDPVPVEMTPSPSEEQNGASSGSQQAERRPWWRFW